MSKHFVLLIIIFGLLIQQLVWRVSDTSNLKQRIIFLFSKKSSNTGFILIGLLIINITIGFIFNPLKGTVETIFSTVGLTVFIIGILLTIWARLAMKDNWGAPAQHNIKTQPKLVTYGPFSFSRNPIYFGTLLMLVGTSLIYFNFLSMFFVLAYFIHLNKIILNEEILLKKFFGGEYLKYITKTPRYI